MPQSESSICLLRDQLKYVLNTNCTSLASKRWKYGLFSFHMNGYLVRTDPENFQVKETIDLRKIFPAIRVVKWRDYVEELASDEEADEANHRVVGTVGPPKKIDLMSSLERKLYQRLVASPSVSKLQKILVEKQMKKKKQKEQCHHDHHPHQCPIYTKLHRMSESKNIFVLIFTYDSNQAEEEETLVMLLAEEKLNVWWDKIKKWSVLPKIKIDLCEDEEEALAPIQQIERIKSVSFDPSFNASRDPVQLKPRSNLQKFNIMINDFYLRADSPSPFFNDIINDTDLVAFASLTEIQIVSFWSLWNKLSSLLCEIFYNYDRQLMSDIEEDYENFHLFTDFKSKLNEKYTSASVLSMLAQRSSLLSVFLDEFFSETGRRKLNEELLSSVVSEINNVQHYRVVEAIEICL